ncbi:MAG TPA: helix-turn-helix domain-containing protein [Hyalangium sp.]|nr:helix-turn-helix domain-containing protein [Hyalangium sp.]
MLEQLSTRDLAALVRFLKEGSALQERHAARIRALAELPATNQPRTIRAHGGLSPAALRRVQLYALAHLDGHITLAALATRAGVSRFHFARAFRTSTGETPYGFVQRLRVEKAQQLLRETDLPLVRIAAACGYSSQSKLTHATRRATGLTPARYRRAYR